MLYGPVIKCYQKIYIIQYALKNSVGILCRGFLSSPFAP